MSMQRGLFVLHDAAGVGTDPLDARRALGQLFETNAPGAVRSGVLDPGSANLVTGTSNMSYNLGPAGYVVARVASEGSYLFSSLGVTNVTTSPAPSQDSRWDVIYVKQNDVEKGDPDNRPVLGVVVGATAATPVVPTNDIPAGGYEVARARVYATATATSQGAGRVEIEQRWQYSALLGTPIPVRNATERATITGPRLRQQVKRLDTGEIESWDGDSWETPTKRQHAEYVLSNFVLPNASVRGVPLRTLDPARSVNPGFVRTVPQDGYFEVLEEGIYAVSLHVEYGYVVQGETFMAFVHLNTTETLHTVNVPAGAAGYTLSAGNIYLKPGTQNPAGVFIVRLYQASGISRTLNGVRIKITRIN